MAYSPRRIKNNHVFEICLRTTQGLPFSCSEVINLLILGIMARANRDEKVKVCHFVWLANHAHILLVANEPNNFSAYYGEIMKKVTETWKALFALNQLGLWQERISVIQLLTPEDVEERITYFYLNPAKANLVSTIDKYPGLSSWHYFQALGQSVDAAYTRPVRWYRYTELPSLLAEPDSADLQSASTLNNLNGYTEESIVLHPNAWMNSFGIVTPDEVRAINQRITKTVCSEQETLRAIRSTDGKSVKGVASLKREKPTLTGWTPKKTERRILVICRKKSLRMAFIKEYKMFRQNCAEARRLVLAGIKNVIWPEGAFVPWFPPLLREAINPCLMPLQCGAP